jgi:polyferredoxin
MVIVLLLTVLFGPVFCGWLCPLGSIQEWVGKLGKRIFKKKFNRFIPYKIDRYLRFTRYLVLALVLYKMAVTAKLLFQDVDPYYAMFNFFTGEVTLAALSILVVTLILSLFIERPWCKYACPYGALLGLANLFRIFKIRRISSACENCGACDRACPMNIKISDSHAVRNHHALAILNQYTIKQAK